MGCVAVHYLVAVVKTGRESRVAENEQLNYLNRHVKQKLQTLRDQC